MVENLGRSSQRVLDALTEAGAPARELRVGDLLNEFVRLTRLLHAAKAELHQEHQGQDRSAFMLLFPLLVNGPQRARELANAVRADPSTVSRQSAELVRLGLVRREADPWDGRASLLAITAQGEQLCAQIKARREQLISSALTEWPAEQLDTFAALLRRFNTDFESRQQAARRVPATAISQGVQ
jgi:DNA-binding MarR family transcriptional regulator